MSKEKLAAPYLLAHRGSTAGLWIVGGVWAAEKEAPQQLWTLELSDGSSNNGLMNFPTGLPASGCQWLAAFWTSDSLKDHRESSSWLALLPPCKKMVEVLECSLEQERKVWSKTPLHYCIFLHNVGRSHANQTKATWSISSRVLGFWSHWQGQLSNTLYVSQHGKRCNTQWKIDGENILSLQGWFWLTHCASLFRSWQA